MSDTDKSELEKKLRYLVFGVVSYEKMDFKPNAIQTTDSLMERLVPFITQQRKDAQIEIIDYTMRKPTGELTMTVEEMKATSDAGWRDEVIQYFFNADSLMFNLQRKKEELQKTTKEVE